MTAVQERVRAGGLLRGPVLVLLSGGRDSVCLLDLAVRLAGPVRALHVNYGLRDTAGDDEAHCRALCERLGVPLEVRRAGAPSGNVQAWARAERYSAARELAAGADIATGHTATDQVETVLYRLAASPGRRALLGMADRDGPLVRPLLTTTREETAAHCRARGLPWREDPTNDSRAYARNRVRHDLLAALRAIHPAAERNVLATLAYLREEAAVLDTIETSDDVAELRALPPALRRVAVQRRADEILALGQRGGTRSLDVGGGLRAVVVYGRQRFELDDAGPARLPVPGRAAFAGGELVCERGGQLPVGDGTLDAAALAGGPLEARPWRAGDRMRPLGLGGTRSLQDLFTDRKVPRARRHRLPVVTCGGEIAWVPGVATGERFRVTSATRERVRLTWRA